MTTINVPGKIVSIDVDEAGDFEVVPLSGGTQATPAAVLPSGKPHTIVLASDNNATNYFKLDASFAVGDIVEVYAVGTNGFFVYDENGAGVTSGGPNPGGARLRKIRTGTADPTWGAS